MAIKKHEHTIRKKPDGWTAGTYRCVTCGAELTFSSVGCLIRTELKKKVPCK